MIKYHFLKIEYDEIQAFFITDRIKYELRQLTVFGLKFKKVDAGAVRARQGLSVKGALIATLRMTKSRNLFQEFIDQ